MKRIIIFIIRILCFVLPKNKNKIMFYSSNDFDDSTRIIYEYLNKENITFKFHWILYDKANLNKYPSNIKVHKKNSFKTLFHYATSKYIFITHPIYEYVFSAKKQKLINLWHGMPIKAHNINEKFKKNMYNCTLLISTSESFIEPISNMTNIDKKFIRIFGVPRNDYMINTKNVIESLQLYKYKKIVTWMPTFRTSNYYNEGLDFGNGLPCVESNDIPKLNEYLFKNNILLIVKFHGFEKKKSIESLSNILFINEMIVNDFNIYNVLGASDALITDYSSVYVDYLLLNRPICFTLNDLSIYQQNRCFYFEPLQNYMPGFKAYNFNDIIVFFEELLASKDNYINDREEIIKLFHRDLNFNYTYKLLKYLELI